MKIKAGIINMNEIFVCCEKGADLLLNSSFGIPSNITNNSPVSVYPITSFGSDFLYNINDNNTIKLGLYDGFPKTFTQQNIKTGIHFNDGIFSIAEYEKKINSNKIKLGLYNHSGSLSNTDSSVIINPHNGIYSIVCSEIVRLKKHIISTIFQFSQSLYYKANYNFYIGAGISLNFINKSEKNNKVIFGVAHVGRKNFSDSETVYEISYVKQLGKYFTIQPDLQYIVNPLGYVKQLKNALTLNLRLLFVFEK